MTRRAPRAWGRARTVAGVAGGALLALALGKELLRPAEQRRWTGSVVGVPYDFRPPTLERVRQRWWNPEDPRVLTPHVLGVGWSVNLGRLARLARGRDA